MIHILPIEKQADGGEVLPDRVDSPKNHYQSSLSPNHTSEDQIWEIPFSEFPSEHQRPIDYTDFELEDFSSWLNDTGPGDNYENTNNVLIAGSENQNMTNMEQLRNFRSFVDIVLGFARLFLYSAEKDFRNSKDHCR